MAFDEQNWKLVVAALAVMGGANIGSILNATTPAVRHDPATGNDLKNLEQHLEQRIDAVEIATSLRFSRNEAEFKQAAKDAIQALHNDGVCQERYRQIVDQLKYHRENDH